jgi:group I intron endonuclease
MGGVIYTIRNLVNDCFYVGSTTNRKERWRTHRNKLRAGKHHCRHLQNAWAKYGEEKFLFSVVEEVLDITLLQAAEDVWLAKYVGTPECYNHGTRSGAPMRGRTGALHPNYGKPMSETTKAALSAATRRQWAESDPRTGTKHSEEVRVKISEKIRKAVAEGRGGKFIPSEETRRKMSEANKGNRGPKGHIRTAEHRRRLSEANKGNQNWLGKKHSEEARQKMSKRVLEVSTNVEFPSLTVVLQYYKMTMPTLRRALVAGTPITKGRFSGLQFKYIDATTTS